MKTITKKSDYVLRGLYFFAGLILFSIAFNFFLLPNNLVFGGVSGLSIIFKDWFDPSMFIFIVSSFLLIFSFIFLGKEKTMGSILGSLLLPVFLKVTELLTVYISFDEIDVLLSAIFGGVIAGTGLGLVYKAGFTTGGTDIINQILHKYLKVTIGNAMLITDGIIVCSSVFVFGLVNFMYAIVVLYIISIMTDRVILGISKSKAFYIVTDKHNEVKNYIINDMGHGATLFSAKGGFSKENQKVIFCVIPTSEYFKLKDGIAAIDKKAFFVATDAYEVYGGE